MFKLCSRRPNEHIPHEERMIGTSANDSDIDAILLVPSGKSIYHVDAISSIQVIDGTFSIDFPDLNAPKIRTG